MSIYSPFFLILQKQNHLLLFGHLMVFRLKPYTSNDVYRVAEWRMVVLAPVQDTEGQ
jgi:hypothetical protein